MSATVHTALYKNYFARELEYFGEMECLSVGAHRYPLKISYLEDLSMDRTGLSPVIAGAARNLADKTSKIGSKSKDDVPQSVPKEQYSLAVNLIKAVGVEGTGILVFVSGIADITELTERFEGMSKFQLYAIHSDLPFEEQEAAFTPAAADKVKVKLSLSSSFVCYTPSLRLMHLASFYLFSPSSPLLVSYFLYSFPPPPLHSSSLLLLALISIILSIFSTFILPVL